MNYFKNVELANKYNISEATVRNWIKQANEGKLALTLHSTKNRDHVANTPANLRLVEQLIEENRKYRNTRSMRTIEPKLEFYEVFSQDEIYEIVRNLEVHHEIPVQYNYFNGGADRWDEYIQDLVDQSAPSTPNITRALLNEKLGYLDMRLTEHQKVNIVDIGAGNALPVKNLLHHLHDKGKLGRYIAIDISAHMLEIAERNIKDWFRGEITFEGHQLDIVQERFASILAKDYLKEHDLNTINLVLFLGGTADNLRVPDDAFRTINESMNPGDLFVHNRRLTTKEMRPVWFNHLAQPGKLTLPYIHSLVFELLNIDESLYNVEVGFDDSDRYHFARAHFNVAVTFNFNFEDGQRNVEFEKGDTILLWRFWQMSAMDTYEQFDRNGFYILHSSQTSDRRNIMTISEVKD